MYGFENMSACAVRLLWGTEEAAEAKRSRMEKRKPVGNKSKNER